MSEYAALHSIQDLVRWGVSRFHQAELFFGHGTDNAWDESRLLVLHALYLPWETPQEYLHCRVTDEERDAVVALLEERIRLRMPAAYLTGHARFAGLDFVVDDRVLVPRSPIAELIDGRFEPWLEREPLRILDLCTGSGCIGIGAATVFDEAEVDLSDISEDALAVAESNIEMHGLEGRVQTVRSDVFDNIEGRYDVILSNPPYVDAEDLADMPEEYQHEPALGLAAGDDGLDIAHRIIAGAADHLTEDGLLIVEVGNSWGAMDDAYPDLPLTWLEFENGGDGVFLVTARDLREWQARNS